MKKNNFQRLENIIEKTLFYGVLICVGTGAIGLILKTLIK
jgi:hypothetical protein